MTNVVFRQNKETNTNPDLLLLEFTDTGSTFTERAVRNNEDVIFEGNTYTAMDFTANVPSDKEQFSAPSLTFSNVLRILGRGVRNVDGHIKCRMIHVDGADYTVSGGVRTYYTALQDTKDMIVVRNTQTTPQSVTGTLGPALTNDLPYPVTRVTKARFPGVYI